MQKLAGPMQPASGAFGASGVRVGATRTGAATAFVAVAPCAHASSPACAAATATTEAMLLDCCCEAGAAGCCCADAGAVTVMPQSAMKVVRTEREADRDIQDSN
ncbi:hypothetical protein [Burkholderia vietnamiensis]|uniref:hypothetical protein n=1 Tax=Burkholderia vietnamiensis TaxID=60552 RepID=UPI000F81127A|nr:hypothetical protein [Burkholderia vietnamiensis]MBE0631406.1 hypothetical protein [Burkholderia vietnamiensis]MBR7997657.1 hypothetical protein [Burkholderia vietnamiensis]MEC4596880.1 hypothetical protein [Burkholderia vietnamiensis]HDR9010415.1 hypothetical protein [Burkholderia vietnamiensis]HDR9016662.1 hypothetical protein [Burkholderia vietnamiensis]